MPDRWTSIVPSTDPEEPNLRRADPSHPLDFWRGRDFQGRYVFQLDGQGALASVGSWPAPAGIDVIPIAVDEQAFRLRLSLVDPEDREIFRALCMTLLEATFHFPRGSAQALPTVIELLFKWQDMLARRKETILKEGQIVGLVGELLFLRDEMLSRLPPAVALQAWRGPYGDEQDFLLNGTIFEIKTSVATSDRRIRVSSEDQLDTTSGPILLCLQGLSVATGASELARTLNELVSEIRKAIADNIDAVDRLEAGLLEVGYVERAEYDSVSWLLSDRLACEVCEGFPRIVRAMLPQGVEKVAYSLRADMCVPFKIDLDATIEGLVSGGV